MAPHPPISPNTTTTTMPKLKLALLIDSNLLLTVRPVTRKKCKRIASEQRRCDNRLGTGPFRIAEYYGQVAGKSRNLAGCWLRPAATFRGRNTYSAISTTAAASNACKRSRHLLHRPQ